MRTLVAVVGSTGVGKTDLALKIARWGSGRRGPLWKLGRNGVEIINGDSLQVYSGLDVLTNVPTKEELEEVKHHLVGHVPWKETYDVTRFGQEAFLSIESIEEERKLPMIVGGTMYYLQDLLFGKTWQGNEGEGDITFTEEEKDLIKTGGSDPALLRLLEKKDPESARVVHPNDFRKVKRRLELILEKGIRASELYQTKRGSSSSPPPQPPPLARTLILQPFIESSELEKKLDRRTMAMIDNGLLDDVQRLYSWVQEPDQEWMRSPAIRTDLGVLQSIGFRDLLPWCEANAKGEASATELDTNLQACVERLKLSNRQYARRQLKWIKNKLGPLVLAQDRPSVFFAKLPLGDHEKEAIGLIETFLGGRNDEVLVERSRRDLASSTTKLPAQQTQQGHIKCEVCSEDEPFLVYTLGGKESKEWESHLKTKRHRARSSRRTR